MSELSTPKPAPTKGSVLATTTAVAMIFHELEKRFGQEVPEWFLLAKKDASEGIEMLVAEHDELHRIAEDVGEADDPFAAWESISALQAKAAENPEKYIIGDNTMMKVFKQAGLTNIHDLQAVFDAIEVALTPPPKSRAYEAGYSDARACALYNLNLAIRDIEAGEDATERLQQLCEQIKTEEMPMSGDMG